MVCLERGFVDHDYWRGDGQREWDCLLFGRRERIFEPADGDADDCGVDVHRHPERRLNLYDHAERHVGVGGGISRHGVGDNPLRLRMDGVQRCFLDHDYLGRQRQRIWNGGVLGCSQHEHEPENGHTDRCRTDHHDYSGRRSLHVRTVPGECDTGRDGGNGLCCGDRR